MVLPELSYPVVVMEEEVVEAEVAMVVAIVLDVVTRPPVLSVVVYLVTVVRTDGVDIGPMDVLVRVMVDPTELVVVIVIKSVEEEEITEYEVLEVVIVDPSELVVV